MADKEMVVVRVESHETDARIVVGFLESWGIEAMISEDDAGDQLPSMEGTHGVKVIVGVDDVDRARRVLAEREGLGEQDDVDDDEEQD